MDVRSTVQLKYTLTKIIICIIHLNQKCILTYSAILGSSLATKCEKLTVSEEKKLVVLATPVVTMWSSVDKDLCNTSDNKHFANDLSICAKTQVFPCEKHKLNMLK